MPIPSLSKRIFTSRVTAVFDPVCGCDDTTYSNECMADGAGVTVASTGECDDGGRGEICDDGEDNDGDGDSDCNDCDCDEDPACTTTTPNSRSRERGAPSL